MADDRDKLLFRMKHLVPKLSHPRLDIIDQSSIQNSASLQQSNEPEEVIFAMTWGNLRGKHSYYFFFIHRWEVLYFLFSKMLFELAALYDIRIKFLIFLFPSLIS